MTFFQFKFLVNSFLQQFQLFQINKNSIMSQFPPINDEKETKKSQKQLNIMASFQQSFINTEINPNFENQIWPKCQSYQNGGTSIDFEGGCRSPSSSSTDSELLINPSVSNLQEVHATAEEKEIVVSMSPVGRGTDGDQSRLTGQDARDTQLSDLQKEKEALKQFILGVRPNPEVGNNKKKKELRQISHFMIDKTLGEGTFGKVKLGIHTITQEKVAIKILEKNKIQDQTDIDRIAREIKILKKIRHPRVIQLYQIIETESELYLIMEHANAGELFDYIVRHDRVDDINAAKFFHQILEGVQHLHELGVCHRDLKPENLLLEKVKENIKIIDFGLSNMYQTQSDTLKTACGSPCYAAPEMIAGKDYKGLQVDIWSCGVILYAMLCGYLPFEDPNTDKLYKKILQCDYSIPNYVSQSGRHLIQKILNTNPEERYTIQQIRSHPWFIKNVQKSKKSEYENPTLQGGLDIFSQKTQISDHQSTQTIQQNNQNQALQEIKINPQLIKEMVQKYRIPLKPTKNNQSGPQDQNKNSETDEGYKNFTVDIILKSLAHNKHNDSTTTYYLLHKKWLTDIEEKHSGIGKSMQISSNQILRSSQTTTGMSTTQQKSKQALQASEVAKDILLTLSTSNCEQIINKIKKEIANQNNKYGHETAKSPAVRAKNQIKLQEDKQKLMESASLVIKSPTDCTMTAKAVDHQDSETTNFNTQPQNQTEASNSSRQVPKNQAKTGAANYNNYQGDSQVQNKKNVKYDEHVNVKDNSNSRKITNSEQSNVEKKIKAGAYEVQKDSRKRIGSLSKRKENACINPYEGSKQIKSARKVSKLAESVSHTQGTKKYSRVGAQNFKTSQKTEENHHDITSNGNVSSNNTRNNTQISNSEMMQSSNKNSRNNCKNDQSSIKGRVTSHSRKLIDKKSSLKIKEKQGYRENSCIAAELAHYTHIPQSKIVSSKQKNVNVSPIQTKRPVHRRRSNIKQDEQDEAHGSKQQLAMKIPILEKNLGVGSMNKRYKSQQRGGQDMYNFGKSGNSMPNQIAAHRYNNKSCIRDQSVEQGRKSSRGISAMSRVSKISGTNVSYQSNLSVIRQNIHRFKHKQSAKKKDEVKGQQTGGSTIGKHHISISICKNTVSSFMGLQIPRKHGQSPSTATAATGSARVSKVNELKQSARISINPRQSHSNQPSITKSVQKKKEFQTKGDQGHKAQLSGSKQLRTIPYDATSSGRSPIKNYGNVTTRNQLINKFNTFGTVMVGNQKQENPHHHRQQPFFSKKQQNINKFLGYGTKATRTFNQKNSVAAPTNYDTIYQNGVDNQDCLLAGISIHESIHKNQNLPSRSSQNPGGPNTMKTINIDLDAFTNLNPPTSALAPSSFRNQPQTTTHSTLPHHAHFDIPNRSDTSPTDFASATLPAHSQRLRDHNISPKLRKPAERVNGLRGDRGVEIIAENACEQTKRRQVQEDSQESESEDHADEKPPCEMPIEYSNLVAQNAGFGGGLSRRCGRGPQYESMLPESGKISLGLGEAGLHRDGGASLIGQARNHLLSRSNRCSFDNQSYAEGHDNGNDANQPYLHDESSNAVRRDSQNRGAAQIPAQTIKKGKVSQIKQSFANNNSKLSVQNSRVEGEQSQIDNQGSAEAKLNILSTPSQSINLQHYNTSTMNTPNADYVQNTNQYKASFKSGSVFVQNNEAINHPSHGAYMRTYKGSISIAENLAKLQAKNHISTYEKQVQMHKQTANYKQSMRQAAKSPTQPSTANKPISATNKQSINGKSKFKSTLQQSCAGSGVANLTTRPLTSHRVMTSAHKNSVGIAADILSTSSVKSPKPTSSKVPHSGFGRQNASPLSRLSLRKKTTLN